LKELFLERFLESFASVVPSSRRYPDWFRASVELRPSSLMLNDAYQSVAATYFGKSVGDSRIVYAAHKLYLKVLRALQNALWSPSESISPWTLCTVFLAVQYEVT
jgi:hypothetical protein